MQYLEADHKCPSYLTSLPNCCKKHTSLSKKKMLKNASSKAV